MSYDKKLIEFSKIDSLRKFAYNSGIVFSDGSSTGYWYRKNKESIEKSMDSVSKLIKEQKKMYIKELNKLKMTDYEATYNYYLLRNRVASEFLACQDLNKFDYNSDLRLKNGLRMYEWYSNNKSVILNSKASIYVEIREQLNEKIKADERRKNLEDNKKRILFYKCNCINKFDPLCKVKFNDGMKMGLWYKNNEEKIINSILPIDIKIKQQKDVYDSYMELIKEFVFNSSLEKFNSEGNIRFTSGALMYLFFEEHINDINNSEDDFSKMIINQYDDYKKNYVDDETVNLSYTKSNMKKD